MASKRKAMLAAAAAILVALAGGRVTRATDYDWAPGDNGSKPFDAVRGGTDSDKQPLYFCRVYYINGFQPGKLNPNLQTCNFGYGGMELTSTVYQVLAPKWVSERDGVVPSYSFEAGTDTDGVPLYFCRASYQGGLQPGTLKKGAGCYIGYGGQEILLSVYEVLRDDLPIVADPDPGDISSIMGGYEANHDPLVLCVADYNGSKQPGKIAADKLCYFSYGGREVSVSYYAAVVAKHPPQSSGQTTLDFEVGNDTDGAPLYACITLLRDGSWQVGKYRPSFGSHCHVGWNGSEVTTGFDNLILGGLDASLNF